MAEPTTTDNDRAERARAGRGSLAYLAKPGRSIVDEFIAERHAEAAAEAADDRPRARQ